MKRLYLILALLLTISCSTTTKVTHETDIVDFSKDIEWRLTQLEGRDADTPSTITMKFNPETGSFKGNGGCNDFSGLYKTALAKEQSPSFTVYSLKISNVKQSRTQCPDNIMKAENRLIALLPKATSCHIDAYTLSIFHNNKEIIRLER